MHKHYLCTMFRIISDLKVYLLRYIYSIGNISYKHAVVTSSRVRLAVMGFKKDLVENFFKQCGELKFSINILVAYYALAVFVNCKC